MPLFAHSGNKKTGVKQQLYSDHIANVCDLSESYLTDCLRNSNFPQPERNFLFDVVRLSAYYHDIGKLDDNSQVILSGEDVSEGRMLNHVDAGVALLLKKYEVTKFPQYLMAAYFVHSHHIGLQNFDTLFKEKKSFLSSEFVPMEGIRDHRNIEETYKIVSEHVSVNKYVNSKLEYYEQLHNQAVGRAITLLYDKKNIPSSAFVLKMAFSCLIDADHTDTGNHYSPERQLTGNLCPKERLQSLDEFVKNIKNNASDKRNENRRLLYSECDTNKKGYNKCFFNLLDAPVGSGKTFAYARFSLGQAEKYSLERIYVILPFTNIISQVVKDYRTVLSLPNESEYLINEIHSKCEFSESWLRHNSNRWNMPINVSTAVQFFESLAQNRTSAIRKLHHLSNSAIVIDEFHNSIPHCFWNYVLDLLAELIKFNTFITFASGSSVQYWDIFGKKMDVYDIVSKKAYKILQRAEHKRVKYSLDSKHMSIPSLNEFAKLVKRKIAKHNNCLIVCNTIQNSITIAEHLKNTMKNFSVYQLSSSLTPHDREFLLNEIIWRLNNNERIIVVATSIIECGINISFELGFREKCGVLSFLQFNGRINRGDTNDKSKSIMFDFSKQIKHNIGGGMFTVNPQLMPSVAILNSLEKKYITPEYCSSAIDQELKLRPEPIQFNLLDKTKSYKTIADEFKIINTNTVTFIIDQNIGQRLKDGFFVPHHMIVKNSVQIWRNKLDNIENSDNMEQVNFEYYIWKGYYDPTFYGIRLDENLGAA